MLKLKGKLVEDQEQQLMIYQNHFIDIILNIKVAILINQNFQDFVESPTLLFINT